MSVIAVAPSRITREQLSKARAEALEYAAYVGSIDMHRAEIDANYRAVAFTASERAWLERLDARIEVLAIVESWCPDVIATLPVFARISELAPAISLRILPRPAFREIADAYPDADGRSHIPTYILLDEQEQELGVFIERPDVVDETVLSVGLRKKAEFQQRYGDRSPTDIPPTEIEALGAETLVTRRELRDIERSEIVAWLERAVAPLLVTQA